MPKKKMTFGGGGSGPPRNTDERATQIAEFYKEYYSWFVQQLSRSLPSIADAEDVAQDVFSRLCSLEDPSSIRDPVGFTDRSMKNARTDWWRKQRRRDSAEKLAQDAATQLEQHPSAESVVLHSESIRKAIATLEQEMPIAYRALHLMSKEGYTAEQTAKVMNMTRHKVSRLVEKALVRLTSSVVSVTPRTTLRQHFDEHKRVMHLIEGEALFDVADDPARPFVVTAGDVSAEAVGTRFSVSTLGNTAIVTVSEGVVRVTSNKIGGRTAMSQPAVPVSAGEQAIVTDGRHLNLKLVDPSRSTGGMADGAERR